MGAHAQHVSSPTKSTSQQVAQLCPLWKHMSEPSRVSSLGMVGLAPVVLAFCCGTGSVLRWVRSCPVLVPLWASVSVSGTWGRRRGTKHLPGVGWRQQQ